MAAVTRVFGHALLGVVCKRNPGKKKYVITKEVLMVKADTEFVELKNPEWVVDADGNPIMPAERYWVSASTIDPYHIIVDMR